jgi:hypothetical protein
VIRVGFHEVSSRSKYDFDKEDKSDIVLLMLGENKAGENASTLALANDFTIPIITPLETAVVGQSVSGTSLTGRVNGSCLQWMQRRQVYSFIPIFAEPGCSGTLMFTGDDIVVGCFKGTRDVKSTVTRGVIVPFPLWKNVQWVDCECANPGSEHQVIAFGTTKVKGPEGFPSYLKLSKCNARSFQKAIASKNSDHDMGGGVDNGYGDGESSAATPCFMTLLLAFGARRRSECVLHFVGHLTNSRVLA